MSVIETRVKVLIKFVWSLGNYLSLSIFLVEKHKLEMKKKMYFKLNCNRQSVKSRISATSGNMAHAATVEGRRTTTRSSKNPTSIEQPKNSNANCHSVTGERQHNKASDRDRETGRVFFTQFSLTPSEKHTP